jgi:beta-mannosidase
MFVDCWPAITWSVVDYYRRPKLGYAALRLAYQPVLPIVVLRNPLLAAGDLNCLESVWVVNDRHQAYPGAWVAVALKRADGEVAFQYPIQADVAPDCARRVFWVGDVAVAGVEATLGDIDLEALLKLPAGDYVVEATVYTAEGEELGHNSTRLTIVPAVAAPPMPI